MGYKVLYRTYRPSTFDEVAGQKPIVKTLQNALKTNQISHAYLFAGPRGTGKTTMAKIFAKALNCEKGMGEICNECENCKSANNGSHPDIFEIDAASNNGVEEVRNIIDRVKYGPMKGRYKVYIIDEVHMMTPGAFNALLKTLEEPPEYVVFILATTEPHKILPTIISRCQRYDFAKVDEVAMTEYMMKVLDKEGIEYEAKALSPIVSLADGGMRDALAMLDQVISYSGGSVTEQDVLDVFGIASLEEKIGLLKDIANKDVNAVLARTTAFLDAGIDVKRLCDSLLDILKDILIYCSTNDETLLEVTREKDIESLLDKIDVNLANEMINTLLKASGDFKVVPNPRSLFEITVLKLSTINANPTKNIEIAAKNVVDEKPTPAKEIINPVIEKPAKEIVKEEVKNTSAPEWLNQEIIPEKKEDHVPVKQEEKKEEIKIKESFDQIQIDGDKNVIEDDIIIKLMVSANKDERQRLTSKWDESLTSLQSQEGIGKYALLLKDGTLYVVAKNIVLIKYDFERLANKVNIKNNQKALSTIVSMMLGRKVAVYALSRSDAIRLQRTFCNLRQISKLPKPEEIEINLEEN